MQGVVARGTASVIRSLGYKRKAAGKTGTSNESRDSWFVGYLPNLVTGAWVGFDDNSKTGLTGGSGAAPIWTYYMQCVESFLPKEEFLRPKGVRIARVDNSSGQRANEYCPADSVISEVFVKETIPNKVCESHDPEYQMQEHQVVEHIQNQERTVTRPTRENIPAKKSDNSLEPRKRRFWDMFG